jgi:hypothetical protein
MKSNHMTIVCAAAALAAAPALADVSVSTYDDLPEGFYGQTYYYNGVTYTDVNNVDGVFPDGGTFEAGGESVESLGNTIVIENATLFYNDFPAWGSPTQAMTFGRAYVNGDNLSLGPVSTVTMNLDSPADSASLDIAFYENGPWGGIVYHLDAYSGTTIVASDSFTIADGGGRDNIATRTLAVSGATFDSLRLSATFGAQFSGPRILMDNLTLNLVTPPDCAADFNQDGGVDGADVEAFYSVWEQGLPGADVNDDGGVDGGDVEAFFLVWEAGGC